MFWRTNKIIKKYEDLYWQAKMNGEEVLANEYQRQINSWKDFKKVLYTRRKEARKYRHYNEEIYQNQLRNQKR